jgi:hypothetical protein
MATRPTWPRRRAPGCAPLVTFAVLAHSTPPRPSVERDITAQPVPQPTILAHVLAATRLRIWSPPRARVAVRRARCVGPASAASGMTPRQCCAVVRRVLPRQRRPQARASEARLRARRPDAAPAACALAEERSPLFVPAAPAIPLRRRQPRSAMVPLARVSCVDLATAALGMTLRRSYVRVQSASRRLLRRRCRVQALARPAQRALRGPIA